MKNLIVTFIFISNLAYSKDTLSLWLNAVNSINNNPSSFNKYICSSEYKHNALSLSNNSDLMLKCAVDLCGMPKDGVTTTILDFNFDRFVGEEDIKKFSDVEPLVKEIVNNKFSKNDEFIEAIKEKTKDSVPMDFSTWEDWEYDNLTYKFYEQYITFESDINKELKERLSYKLDLPGDASEVFKKGIKAFADAKIKKSYENPSNGIYNDLYTLDEAKEIVLKKYSEFLTQLEKVRENKPDALTSEEENLKSISEKISSIDSIEEVYDVGGIFLDIKNMMGTLIYEDTGAYPSGNISYTCSSPDCKKGIEERINKLDITSLVNELEKNNKNKKELLLDKLSYCKSEFVMKSIKDYDKKEFKEKIPSIKKQFVQNVFSTMSEDSKKKFNNYIDNKLNFSMNKKTEDAQDFLNEIKNEYKSYKSNNQTPEKYSDKSKKDLILKLIDYQDDFKGKMDPLNGVYVCSDYPSSQVWDAFAPQKEVHDVSHMFTDINPDKDNIFVSMFTCSNHDQGKGVLSHELGHALSWAFHNDELSSHSYKKYLSLRSCASGLYKNNINTNKPPMFSHTGDHYRTEEDMADLIAYIADPDPTTLFECSLLEPTRDGESYNNLALINKIEVDTHSAPLLRVLQEAIHKKIPLTNSCQDLIEINRDAFRFEPCF